MNVVQINLHHAKAASATFTKLILERNIKLALIQEPYVVKGRVAGLSACNGNVIYDVSSPKPRTCIYISKEVQYLPLWNYTSDDMTVVKLKHQEGGVSKELIVCSCYLPYEKPDPVSRELQNLVNHAEGERLDYILGVDANAHHAAWASRDTNNRGTYPLISITTLVHQLHIAIPKKTNWELFTKVLKRKMGDMKVEFRNSAELDATAHDFQCAVANTMKLCCPETKRPNTKQPTWWNNNLEGLRKKTRKLWNKAKRDGNRETFSMSLKTYSRELRKAKRNSWRSYCESIENVDAAARLQKIMARDPAFGIGNLVKPDGTYTKSGEEMLTVLMATHYPEHRCATSNPSDNTVGVLKRIPSRHDWREATAIASETRIRAAVGYADDFVIVVRGKDKTTLTELLQYALSIVERWCLRKGLRVNPLKTTLVPFTNKYKMGTLVAPMIFGGKIKIADHTKFLGIHLDKRLTWNQHVKSTTDKAKTTFNMTAIKADMPIDCMIPKTNLNYSYTTLIRPRSACEGRGDERILKNAGIKYYTDGSRTNEGSGAGLCGPGFCRRSASLGLSSTVYQTEVFSIIMGARHALDLGWRDRKITFFSDSQAAIKTLTTTKVQSKLAWECIGTLNDLAASNQVHLEWIPGHRDIQGNETADKMARIGAGTKFIGPEPVLGLTKSTLKTELESKNGYQMKQIELGTTPLA
ncbi:hypothetical protein WDU94_007649 [Cyamophila willieti]